MLLNGLHAEYASNQVHEFRATNMHFSDVYPPIKGYAHRLHGSRKGHPEPFKAWNSPDVNDCILIPITREASRLPQNLQTSTNNTLLVDGYKLTRDRSYGVTRTETSVYWNPLLNEHLSSVTSPIAPVTRTSLPFSEVYTEERGRRNGEVCNANVADESCRSSLMSINRRLSHPDFDQRSTHWVELMFDFDLGPGTQVHTKLRRDLPLRNCSSVFAVQLGVTQEDLHMFDPKTGTELDQSKNAQELQLRNGDVIRVTYDP